MNGDVRVETTTYEHSQGGMCVFEHADEPLAVVIFGATGDLTSRKLFPALYRLFRYHGLPENFLVVGASRSDLTHEAFRERMREALREHGEKHMDGWDEMARRVFYCPVADFGLAEAYGPLADFLDAKDRELSLGGNRLFYLAVPPEAYEDIARGLGASGLSRETLPGRSFSRIVVEKPFGSDLETAKALDATLHESFREHQIFRIDHYLAKETVQNVIMLRFANSIFEPLWNRNYVASVHITAAESLGVEHRAGYYEKAGVLRDMFQNHMMQLLALSAMEPPSIFEGERVRDEKTKLYRSLKPFPLDRLDDHLVLGQYGAGEIDGKKVVAYVDEPGVAKDSRIPTLASLKVFVDNWRWQGVPFHLVSGKRLRAKRTEIAVQFKEVPCSMFRHILGDHISANRLVLGIQPREEITLSFQTKTPGPKMCLRTVRMNFDYGQGYTGPALDAYEKVLIDCMLGDHTLFWRQDGVELCWSFLTPILNECEMKERLFVYPAGSDGPERMARLLERREIPRA
ncbi:glucose-6-phosphate 1-dehydrogenase [Alkalidesulfovibrio alkalitolerans DSM 16529]|uniref:Glucose-6-phosphate 1-dehydrogenase n=1 Tax=Alkalidesulfovibrio alkalitolerans DSM 16529 TaxID=1121439 RepID=S7T4Z5_9BACT|nr:glucose-6-phosphate 1-dehydrogenase [Alkalidesulfovibrio alkalitolerans DSM 16529]